MTEIELKHLERRLERIETLLARLVDTASGPKGQKNKHFDPKYFAARVREVGLAQAAAEHNR